MIRRLVLAGAAATLAGILASGPALAQESIDSGEWAGSSVTRPAPVTTDPGSTIVEGRFQRDAEFSRPDVQVVVTAPPSLHPACPHLDPRSIPATVTSEGRSSLVASAYRFNAGVPFGPRVCNGAYGVTVVADVPGLPGSQNPTLTTAIDVAVPPTPVVGVTAERVDGRTVEVSWAPPADPPPDMIGYRVIRTSSAGDVTVFTISDPSATDFTDSEPPAEGGETRYQVVARRSAPGGEVESTGGEAATPVTVDPEPDTDDPAGDGGGSPGTTTGTPGATGGSGTSGRPGSSVRRPLTGTSAGFPPLTAPSPPTTLDTGFGETLPFGDRELGDADPVLPDELASRIFDEEPGRGLAIPIATALVLAVWAFHLRYLAKAARPVG